MAREYTITVMKSDGNCSFLRRGFLKCIVRSCTSPRQRQFAYCLHCRKLKSLSWFYAHRNVERFPVTPGWCDEMEAIFERHVGDINSEVDVLFEEGSLFKVSRRETLALPVLGARHGPERQRPHIPRNPQDEDGFSRSVDPNAQFDSAGDSLNEVSSSFSARLANCITDCFEEFCFDNSTFDIDNFLLLSQQLFLNDSIQHSFPQEQIDILRGKVLSMVLRKVFVLLSLSKSQTDVLNRLVKAIILFIAPEKGRLARTIHAGYLSCLREATRKSDERDSNLRSLFESCRYFSIGLDTALFGQDHVMSCIVRFSLDDRIEQMPFFLSVCGASSGEEIAAFVFRRLKEKRVPFSKLLSIATDGASNMTGSVNGMVAHLKRMVREEAGRENCILQPLWCFAHRLNLVIRDFQHVPCINAVIRFLDWFTSKRMAVVYKWLRQLFPQQRFRKIPKPSVTRWSFYWDSLKAVLSQMEQIEVFLENDEDFGVFQQEHGHLFGSVTSDNPTGFFSNSFIDAHFHFASFVLERICCLNTQMQEQYSLVHETWESVQSLRRQLETDLVDMERGSFGKFTYVGDLDDVQRGTFVTVLKRLILNINIRFPCINTSIDTRLARHNTNDALKLNESLLYRMRRSCPFMVLVGIFVFPDDLIKHQMVNEFFLGGRYPEIEAISREIVTKKDEIGRQVQTSYQTQQRPTPTITLLDVFKVIDRRNYPFLWEVVVKTLTILPTTVSCEQSFSCLKHRLHENMLKETAFCFLGMVQRHTEFQYEPREVEQRLDETDRGGLLVCNYGNGQ